MKRKYIHARSVVGPLPRMPDDSAPTLCVEEGVIRPTRIAAEFIPRAIEA